MNWIPVPNKHDGDGYTQLVDHPAGAAHFGAWMAILQVASRCHPRGTLVRSGGIPHTAASLGRITRLPASIFEDAIPRLLEIGWLETFTHEDAATAHVGAVVRHDDTAQSRIEMPPDSTFAHEGVTTVHIGSTGREVHGIENGRAADDRHEGAELLHLSAVARRMMP